MWCVAALCAARNTHTHTKEKIARARTREGSEDGSRCKQHDKTKRSKKQEARSTHTRAHTTKINKVANDTLRFEIDLRVIKREHTPTHLNLAHAQQSLTCGLRHVSVAAAAKRTHTHTRPNRSGATTRMRNKVKPLLGKEQQRAKEEEEEEEETGQGWFPRRSYPLLRPLSVRMRQLVMSP